MAVKKMELVPSDIWFVGDKPEYDILGALDAGLYPVWYNWRNEPISIEGEFLVVHNMRELRGKIESLDTID